MRVAKKPEYQIQILFGIEKIQILQFGPTIRIVFEYRIICHTLAANSTTIHSRLVRHDRNVCLYWNTLFSQSGKTAVTFAPIMQLTDPV